MESCCYYQYLSISINYYHNIFKYHPNIIQISKSSRGQSQDPWNWPELDGTGWTFAPVVIHFLRLVRTLLNAVISAQEKGSTWLRAVTLTMQMRSWVSHIAHHPQPVIPDDTRVEMPRHSELRTVNRTQHVQHGLTHFIDPKVRRLPS